MEKSVFNAISDFIKPEHNFYQRKKTLLKFLFILFPSFHFMDTVSVQLYIWLIFFHVHTFFMMYMYYTCICYVVRDFHSLKTIKLILRNYLGVGSSFEQRGIRKHHIIYRLYYKIWLETFDQRAKSKMILVPVLFNLLNYDILWD